MRTALTGLRALPRTLSAMASPTIIDGSTLEGGGQILRNSTALAALLGKPVTINNVRAGRSSPGLKAQHAAGLNLVAETCSAKAEGINKGSSTVSFEPGPIKADSYSADPGTAGSTILLLQISLPCLLFAKGNGSEGEIVEGSREGSSNDPVVSTLTLRGGTNALHAPPVDYTQHVFLPFLHRHFNLPKEYLTLDIKKRGYFPYGGGELRVRVPALRKGHTLPAVTLTERGRVIGIDGLVYVSGSLPKRIASEIQRAAFEILTKSLSEPWAQEQNGVSQSESAEPNDPATPVSIPPMNVDVLYDSSGKAGSGIILWAKTANECVIGGSALGAKGTNATKTGRAAAEELISNLKHGGCVDEYMQDQMIIFLALAKGKSTVRTGPLTLHTKTAIWVAERLTKAKLEVTSLDESGQRLITCDGIGLEGNA